jgi:hypothetical protein
MSRRCFHYGKNLDYPEGRTIEQLIDCNDFVINRIIPGMTSE